MPRASVSPPPRRDRRDDEDRGGSSRHRSSRRYDDDDEREARRSRRYDDDDDRHASSSRRHHRDHDERRDRDRDGEKSSRHRDEDRSSRRDRDDKRSSSHRHHRKRSYDSEDEEERRRRRKDKRHRDETSQERKDRKASKRAAAEQRDATDRANVADLLMYSTGGGDNHFNDANLSQAFKWGKKAEKEKKMGLTPEEAARRDAERRREAQEEIAKLNVARAQREAEQKVREEEEAQMARLAESAAMAEWVAKEDDFYLEQSRRRAAIRIRENRAKPIDLLAMNLRWADGDRIKAKRLDGLDRLTGGGSRDDDEDDDEAGLEIDLEEPYEIFESLTLQDTEELYGDIQMYLELDKDERNLEFWRSMIIVCDDKLADLREQQGASGGDETRPRMDPTIKANMNRMLADKSYDELEALQNQVRDKLRSGEPIDVEYWEGLLKQIVVWRAKAKLRDLHEVVLENRLEYLRRKQRYEASRQQEELVAQLGEEEGLGVVEEEDEIKEAEATTSANVASPSAWDADEMEPRPLDESRLNYDDRHLPIETWDTLRAQLISARRKVLGASFVPRARTGATATQGEAEDAAEALFAQEAAKGIDVNEEAFDEELGESSAGIQTMRGGGGRSTGADAQTYDWEDKYRPRKPRYFNRVHTGFEWNKYNQTHYDSDNPPPKVVQGYKFNIFYPDLIDKSKAPTYRILKDEAAAAAGGSGDETVILKFEAGAPYEDIAFRIVNKPWQYSHKRGFKSSFDRGVLQLYFNFQRSFYRK